MDHLLACFLARAGAGNQIGKLFTGFVDVELGHVLLPTGVPLLIAWSAVA
jgi:hypothetical protein